MEPPTVLAVNERRLNQVNSEAFGERLLLALGGDGSKRVIVDFSGVEAISSIGFRALVLGLKKAKSGNGEIVVAGLRGIARDAFLVTRLDLAFTTFDTLALAQRAFNNGADPL